MIYKLHKDLSKAYGYRRVLIRTIEELSELIQALTNPALNDYDLSEEIVDCRMCFAWLKRQWNRNGFHFSSSMAKRKESYTKEEFIYNLSKMQFLLSKELRGFGIKDEHLQQMAVVYFMMDYITQEKDLYDKNAYWTRVKENLYIRRLKNNELR